MSVPPNVPGAPEGPQGQQPPYAPQGQAPQGYSPQGYAPQPGHGVPPQPPKKKGKGKFIALGVVALVLIAIIGGALGGGGDEKAGDPAPSSTSKVDDSDSDEKSDDTSDEAKSADKAPGLPALGEAVVAGDLEFTLTDYECGVTVKDVTGEVKPQGKFCKIHVSVKNIGKSEKFLSNADVKLFTEDDIEYSASSDVWLVDDVINLDRINPGITISGDVYFDIPEDAEPSFAGVGGGIFSKPTLIDLG